MAHTNKKRRKTSYIIEQIVNPEIREIQINGWRDFKDVDISYKEERIVKHAKTMKNALRKARGLGAGSEITIFRKGSYHNINWMFYYDGFFWK